MTDAIIVGAGPIGLATAMLLSREGYTVTVLEKDGNEPPDDPWEVWETWQRTGVAQFRQPHFIMPRARQILDAELSDVRERLVRLGGGRFSMIEQLPRSLPDRSPQPGDERFETVAARRPVLEAAFAHAARETPGVTIRRGVGAEAPIQGASTVPGTPHVAGVRTTAGEELRGELVVDAMGRRSKLPEWVAAVGGRPPFEEASDAGFAYYTRHFRSPNGTVPDYRGPIGADVATLRVLTLRGDNGAWTVALIPMAGDAPFKALRHSEQWTRVLASFPHAAHWLEGEPLGEVLAMAGVLDRRRRTVVNGDPVVTGLVPVGDAWACTNPTAGRGISLGLAHAVALRDALRATRHEPADFVRAFDDVTERTLTPWYQDQVARDRQRAADVQATIDGREPQIGPERQRQAAFFASVGSEPAVARGWFDILCCLALPEEVMRRPEVLAGLAAHAGESPRPMPGPTRADLLSVL